MMVPEPWLTVLVVLALIGGGAVALIVWAAVWSYVRGWRSR
jgi:hypothetical protein